MLLAESFLQFLPPLTAGQAIVLAAAAAGITLLVSWLLGPPNPVARHWGLASLRATIIGLVVFVLANPVVVDERAGPVKRPEVFYLLDASASMQMGNPRSRWDESIAMIRAADSQAPDSPAVVKPFRFGQRLAAIDQPQQVGIGTKAAAPLKITTASASAAEGIGKSKRPIQPLDGDTRLQSALRQISSRFGRVPPQGIVVFSDGRIHDETGLEQIAAGFAKLNVPIHVVPVGDTAKGGAVRRRVRRPGAGSRGAGSCPRRA
jgi:hypothetical protein